MRRLSLCVAVLAAAALLAPSLASAASWSGLSPLNPSGYVSAQLSGVSCTSSTFCITDGRWDDGVAPAGLIESWTSTNTWAQQRAATPPAGATTSGLTGIHCTSSTVCTAVGDYTDASFTQWALVERLASGAWGLQTFPRPVGATATSLSSVSCTSSTFCMAVGAYADASGVSQPLAASWNGTSWTLRTVTPVSGHAGTGLSSVSCTTSSACVAIGTYFDGSTPKPMAVTWNGTSWSSPPVTLPLPSGSLATFATGLSCTSSTACTAVGFWTDRNGVVSAWAARLASGTWSPQTLAAPPAGSTGSALLGVSCTTGTHCTAVGYFLDANGAQRPLAEGWNGTTWSYQATTPPANSATAVLQGVSCTSSSACLAVGYNIDSISGLQQTLAQRYA